MAPPLREPALVKGDVKAISGFYFTGFLNLTENLKVPADDVVAFLYSNYGIDLYGNAVVVRDGLAEGERGDRAQVRGRRQHGHEVHPEGPAGGHRLHQGRWSRWSTRPPS